MQAEAVARRTPYELVFADTSFETEGFPALREEAEARGVDTSAPERFLLLGTAGRLLRELGATDAVLEPLGMLLYHAYHFWRAGRPLFVVDAELARALPELTPSGDAAEVGPPAPAGYLQLPRNLFWARVDEAAAPEPVDGLFWTMMGGADGTAAPARADVLLALGLRPGRPGFSVIPVGEPLHGRSLLDRAGAVARPGGDDFANVLPGGELGGLFAITTPAEALKLLALVSWYVARHPGAVGDVVAPPEPAPAPSGPAHALGAARLPFRRVRRVHTRMDKQKAARVLNEIATLLELRGEEGFRARAFQNAARALEDLEEDLAGLVQRGELRQVRGLGPKTAQVVEELFETGTSSYHQELRRQVPEGLLELLRVPGLGPKRIHTLHARLGVASLDDVERAAREGRVAGLPGFGKRTEERVLEGIAYRRRTAGRRRRPEALAVAAELLDRLRADAAVTRAEPAGELRRGLEAVRGVDIVAAVEGDAEALLASFLALPGASPGERMGANAARVPIADEFEVRLRCAAPAAFAAAWLHATGSQAHVHELAARAAAQGLRLDADGLWDGTRRVDAPDEDAIYRALGLDVVAPELREGEGEVEAAGAGLLPQLVAYEDLKGCFHVHTTYSDGRATLKEMAHAARARGWRYLGIADHSQAAAYAGGLRLDDIARQHDEIDAWNAEHGDALWLFKGIEADILADGRLDYAALEDDVLGRFDYVVGAVHSVFGLSEAAMTERIVRAVEDPHLTFLGHLTGRILLERDGYPLNVDAVIEAAAERGVGIEINSHPARLDLDWRWWRAASARGVHAAINPDAHDAASLDDVRYGVTVARKGWLGVRNVVNAWEVDPVKAYLARRKV